MLFHHYCRLTACFFFFSFFSLLISIMKSLHLLVETHEYQCLILASLILVICQRNSISRVSTIQLNLSMKMNTDFESVTNFRLVYLLPFVAYTYTYINVKKTFVFDPCVGTGTRRCFNMNITSAMGRK